MHNFIILLGVKITLSFKTTSIELYSKFRIIKISSLGLKLLRLLSDVAGGLILSFDHHLNFHIITILFVGVMKYL